MEKLAVMGGRDPLVRLIGLELIDGVAGRDHEGICRRVFHWAQSKGPVEKFMGGRGIKFVNDPYQVEGVRAPWWILLVEGAGDCNSSHAVACAALLLSLGIPCKFRTVAADPRRSQEFSHVYLVAMPRGRELAMDTSVNFSTPGSKPKRISRVKDWPIRVSAYDEDDRGGLL